MPSLEVWGPAVWTLFHTLAERVHEDAYPFIARQLFEQIVRICKVLPCPDCSTDASNFLANINVSTLKTKTDFKNLIYLFHNYVNAKKRKQLFNVLELSKYKYYKLIPVVNNFLINFNTKGNMNLINESFQRSLVQNNFKKWIAGNLHAFTAPIRIQPVTNIIEEEEDITNIVQEEEEAVTNIVQEEEDITNIIEEEEAVTNIVEEEEAVTNIVEEEEDITNIVQEEDITNIVEEVNIPKNKNKKKNKK